MLVEILGTNEFFCTRQPGFTGPWVAGDGLLAGSGGPTAIANASERPDYDGGLRQLVDGGIGDISYAIDAEGLARTGNTSLEILNQELFSLTLENNELVNAVVRIRLGFFGGVFSDYLTIFQGSIEDFRANYESLGVELVDDTVNHAILTPPQLGADFFPQSVTTGRPIPILLGDTNFVPAIDIIKPASAKLVFEFTATDVTLSVFDDEPGQRFPANGELTLAGSAAEVLTYNRIKPAINNGIPVLEFSQLTRTAPVLHTAGDDVTLTSVEPLKVLAFYGGDNVRRARLADGVHPTSTITTPVRVLDPIGNDDRIVQALVTQPDEAGVSVSMSGANRGPNLVVDGEGNNAVLASNWVVVAGTWVGGFTPAGESEPLIHGQVDAFQGVQSEMRQDISTVAGQSYRLTFSARMPSTDPAPYQQVLVGTPTSPSAIHNFGEMRFTVEQGYDLSFTAIGITTRITLLIDDTGVAGIPFNAYFDHFQMYDLATENPMFSVSHLIERHIPQIQCDTASFAVAEAKYALTTDRMAGLIDSTQEAQNLLGRIAEQFRAKTWLTEDGLQKWKVFDNTEPPVRKFDPTSIDKGTLSVTQEPVDSIYTHFYVYYNKRNDLAQGSLGGRESYQGVLYATPEDTNHTEQAVLQVLCKNAQDTFRVTRVREIFCDMIPDPETAAQLLDLYVRLHTHRRILVQFTTYLNGTHVEVTDFVQITHPLIPSFANGVNYEVLEKQIHPNGMLVSFICAEVRQSIFGSFIEEWEPLQLLVPALLLSEDWEPPPVPQQVENDEYPFIEEWQASVVWHSEIFADWFSDGGSFEPRLLTDGLSAHFDFREADLFGQDYYPTNRFGLDQFTNNGKRHRWTRSSQVGDADEEKLNPPIFLPTGGPNANTPCLQFDTVDDAMAGGLIHGSQFIGVQYDWTISLWVLLESKPLESMFIMSNTHDIRSAEDDNREHSTYVIWWDAVLDTFMARVWYNEDTPGPIKSGESWFADMRTAAEGFNSLLTGSVTPTVGQWYNIMLRVDHTPNDAVAPFNYTYELLIDGVSQEKDLRDSAATFSVHPYYNGLGYRNEPGTIQDLFFLPDVNVYTNYIAFDGYHRDEISSHGIYFSNGFDLDKQRWLTGTFLGRHPWRKQTGLSRGIGFHGRIGLVYFYSRHLSDGDVTNIVGGGTPAVWPFGV